MSSILGKRGISYVGPSSLFAPMLGKFKPAIMQLGIEFEDSASCWNAVDKLSKVVTSLRTEFDGKNVTFNPSLDPEIRKFPEGLSWKESCDSVYAAKDGIMSSSRMANICVSDRRLILNMSHALGDGGYFLLLISMLSGDREVPSELPCLPLSAGPVFRQGIAALKGDERWTLPDTLTRIKSRTDVTNLRRLKYEDVCEVKTLVSDVHDLQCYDKKTGKCSGLTDYLWTSLVLCSEAWNGSMTKFGIESCVDHRQRSLASSDLWSLGCCFTIISHSAPVNPSESIQSLGRRLRQDFLNRINSPAMYSFFTVREREDRDLVHLELSHLGRMRIKRPMTDVWVLLQLPEAVGACNFALLSWAVENEHSNTLRGHLRFSPSRFDPAEAEIMRDSIKFFIESLPPTTTVADAFAAVQKFQATRISNSRKL